VAHCNSLGKRSFTFLRGGKEFDISNMSVDAHAGVDWSAAYGRGSNAILDLDGTSDATPGGLIASGAIAPGDVRAAMWCTDVVGAIASKPQWFDCSIVAEAGDDGISSGWHTLRTPENAIVSMFDVSGKLSMDCQSVFRVLMGELMPVTALGNFHTTQLQMQIAVGMQNRHYVVVGDKDSDPAWEKGAGKCDVHVFEVHRNPNEQDRLAWVSALAHFVAREMCPELFQRALGEPNELQNTVAHVGSGRRSGTIASTTCGAKLVLTHKRRGAKAKKSAIMFCPGCRVPL
jgi:hypothetical protein